MAVMGQSIEQRRRELRITEHRGPLREREVRRDDCVFRPIVTGDFGIVTAPFG
jgi:hypothetical protein